MLGLIILLSLAFFVIGFFVLIDAYEWQCKRLANLERQLNRERYLRQSRG